MTRSIFTYGSLMFERVWHHVVAGHYARLPATLQGFRRQRVRGASYPSLQRCEGHAIAGILYLGVAPADVAALDAFEGEDYRRITVQVALPPPAGSASPRTTLLEADTYLFVADAKVEPGDWDAARFEREQLEAFLRDHSPQASSPTRSRQRTMSTGPRTSKPSRPGRAT